MDSAGGLGRSNLNGQPEMINGVKDAARNLKVFLQEHTEKTHQFHKYPDIEKMTMEDKKK